MTDTTINVMTLEGTKLVLSTGDTLAITYPGVLHPEQREHINAACAAAMPGIKVIVLDGGLTIAAIKQAE